MIDPQHIELDTAPNGDALVKSFPDGEVIARAPKLGDALADVGRAFLALGDATTRTMLVWCRDRPHWWRRVAPPVLIATVYVSTFSALEAQSSCSHTTTAFVAQCAAGSNSSIRSAGSRSDRFRHRTKPAYVTLQAS